MSEVYENGSRDGRSLRVSASTISRHISDTERRGLKLARKVIWIMNGGTKPCGRSFARS